MDYILRTSPQPQINGLTQLWSDCTLCVILAHQYNPYPNFKGPHEALKFSRLQLFC